MSELTQLIVRLKKAVVSNEAYIKTIRNPILLIQSLIELNELIGNEKVKDSVATQVSHLILAKMRALDVSSSIKEDEVMLHTVLYGPPGVGKTLVSTKLAKIWYSLGYLDGKNNKKEKKQEIGSLIKDLLKDGSGGSSTDDTSIFVYGMVFFFAILVTFLSMTWSFYTKFGGTATMIVFVAFLCVLFAFGYYFSTILNNNTTNDNTKDDKSKIDEKNNRDIMNNNKPCSNNKNKPGFDDSVPSFRYDIQGNNTDDSFFDVYSHDPSGYIPRDEDIIKVVTRADFVDRYVGWTSPKTNKLLEENLGKVLFVDEAYSLINGPHDEFGMEALTALNLFLSQHPKEIIVIFAGYKDLLESGPYAVQPGLQRRFMWQFESAGYNAEQLYRIFRLQLNKKGWDISDVEEVKTIFNENMDAFPAYGGDTERAGFFAELEHSRDYIANPKSLKMNILHPNHIRKGIQTLRDNNFKEGTEESKNPLANMMKYMAGKNKNSCNNNKKSEDTDMESLFQSLMDHSSKTASR
jgi:hypothetical protein